MTLFRLWPLIWPSRPSLAFYDFSVILDTQEGQWYVKMSYPSSITSRTFSEPDLAFRLSVIHKRFQITIDENPPTREIFFQQKWVVPSRDRTGTLGLEV